MQKESAHKSLMTPVGAEAVGYGETESFQTGEEGFYLNSKGAYLASRHDHAIRMCDMALQLLTHIFTDFSQKEFDAQWEEKQSAFSGVNKQAVSRYSNIIGSYLLRYSPKSVAPVLTDDGSLHVSASFDFFTIYIEAFFEAGREHPVETVLNIYSNKECRLAATGSWAYIKNQIEYFIFSAVISLFPATAFYGLPGETAASAPLPDYFLAR